MQETDAVKAAITAWCINKLGGEVRIPRQTLQELVNGQGAIYITGDPVKNEYIIRTEQIVKGEETDEQVESFKEKYDDDISDRLLGDVRVEDKLE